MTSSDDTVIVESQGQPKAAVISFERFQKLRELERDAQREANMRWLRKFEASRTTWRRNDDLTEEQIEDLADRFSREFVDDLIADGKIRFEDDRDS